MKYNFLKKFSFFALVIFCLSCKSQEILYETNSNKSIIEGLSIEEIKDVFQQGIETNHLDNYFSEEEKKEGITIVVNNFIKPIVNHLKLKKFNQNVKFETHQQIYNKLNEKFIDISLGYIKDDNMMINFSIRGKFNAMFVKYSKQNGKWIKTTADWKNGVVNKGEVKFNNDKENCLAHAILQKKYPEKYYYLSKCKDYNFSDNNLKKAEQKIIEDIFPELFKQTFQDFRKIPTPPPPPANDSKEELEKMDKAFEKSKEDHKIFLDTTKFAPLYVIVNDSAWGIPKSELKRMFEKDNENIKFIDTTVFKKSFKIDLRSINLGKDYVLKYKSDFSQNIGELIKDDALKHPWKEEKQLQQFSGMLSLSRIYFNKEHNYGFLNVSFSCGKLCGCGYIVFVKKENNKWTIDKINSLGCS